MYITNFLQQGWGAASLLPVIGLAPGLTSDLDGSYKKNCSSVNC